MDGAANLVDSDSDSYERKLTKEGSLREDIAVNNHHSQLGQKGDNLPQPAPIAQGNEEKVPADVEMRRSDSDDGLDTPMPDDPGNQNPQHLAERNNLGHEQDPHDLDVPRLRQEVTLGEWVQRSKDARKLRHRSNYSRTDNRRYGMSRREYTGNWDDARGRGGGPITLNGGYGGRGGRSGSGRHGSY